MSQPPPSQGLSICSASSTLPANMTTKSAPPKPEGASARSEPVKLSPERARELAREGFALRREIQERFAKMRVLTEEDLKLRTR